MKHLTPIIFILLSLSAGWVGSIFTSPAIPTWYASLNKPAFNPPGWLFAPVWTILFILMGIASYLIWLKWNESTLAKAALVLFFVHLIFNVLWSILFFGLQNPGWALVEIAVLWVLILALIIIFYRLDQRAAWLLIPYILWVSFASVLNFAIWRLN